MSLTSMLAPPVIRKSGDRFTTSRGNCDRSTWSGCNPRGLATESFSSCRTQGRAQGKHRVSRGRAQGDHRESRAQGEHKESRGRAQGEQRESTRRAQGEHRESAGRAQGEPKERPGSAQGEHARLPTPTTHRFPGLSRLPGLPCYVNSPVAPGCPIALSNGCPVAISNNPAPTAGPRPVTIHRPDR